MKNYGRDIFTLTAKDHFYVNKRYVSKTLTFVQIIRRNISSSFTKKKKKKIISSRTKRKNELYAIRYTTRIMYVHYFL